MIQCENNFQPWLNNYFPFPEMHHLPKETDLIRWQHCTKQWLAQPDSCFVEANEWEGDDDHSSSILQFEDDRTCTVATTGNHHLLVVGPAFHDRTALQSRIDITADAIPSFGAELPFIIFQNHRRQPWRHRLMEHRTHADLGISKISLLQPYNIPFSNRNFTFVVAILFLSH